jgi:hypothetical protein
MEDFSRGWKYLFIALTILMAGCVNTKIVYKPNAVGANVLKLPIKLAVLPFKDGTEDFTTRGHLLDYTLTYNLVKTGSGSGAVDALPPIFWARAFADELGVSGSFQSVRFFSSPSELTNEEFFIEGTVVKSNYNNALDSISEFSLSFQARQKADNRLVWEKDVTRSWKLQSGNGAECGLSPQCSVDQIHADINEVMQSFFAEARTDLVRTLASLGDRNGQYDPLSAVSSETLPAGEAVDREIERILKGN